MCNVNPLPHVADPAPAQTPSQPADFTAEDFRRPTATLIYEETIKRLEKEKRGLESERDAALREAIVWRDRVAGFERITRSLAAALDDATKSLDGVLKLPRRFATAATEQSK